MPPPMSLESDDTTPERMAEMSGQAKRSESGTRSNSDDWEVAFPFDGARPWAGAATSGVDFPFAALSAAVSAFICSPLVFGPSYGVMRIDAEISKPQRRGLRRFPA